jgi:hypothetical protein
VTSKPVAPGKFVSERPVSFNFIHGIQLDYVTGVATSIGISAEFYKTFVNGGRNADAYVTDSNFMNKFYFPDGLMRMNGRGFGFYVKRFKKGYIAPYGRYHKFELVYYSNTYDDKSVHLLSANPDPQGLHDTLGIPEGSGHFNVLNLGVSFGKQRIFKDKYVTDFGLRFMLTTKFYGNGQIDYSGASIEGGQEYLYQTALFRVNRLLMLGVYLRINFLAF